MEKVNANELDYRHGESGPKYLFRGPRIDWGLIRFLPGESLGRHMHNEVEETFYFLSGSGALTVDELEYDIQPGEAFRIEPGEMHDIRNTTEKPLEGIFIKHCYRPDDKVSAEQ